MFQFHNLLPSLSAQENVEIPMFGTHRRAQPRRARAAELLDEVGLSRRAKNRPNELSGGERQHIAIARALANDPPLLLADEPTGSLDSKAGRDVLQLFEAIRTQRDLTVVMVTHDMTVAGHAGRTIHMLDGPSHPIRRPRARQSRRRSRDDGNPRERQRSPSAVAVRQQLRRLDNGKQRRLPGVRCSAYPR